MGVKWSPFSGKIFEMAVVRLIVIACKMEALLLSSLTKRLFLFLFLFFPSRYVYFCSDWLKPKCAVVFGHVGACHKVDTKQFSKSSFSDLRFSNIVILFQIGHRKYFRKANCWLPNALQRIVPSDILHTASSTAIALSNQPFPVVRKTQANVTSCRSSGVRIKLHVSNRTFTTHKCLMTYVFKIDCISPSAP